MGDAERRKNVRHEIEIGVSIRKKGEKVSAAMINISRGGVGLISDREILLGEKVHITVNHVSGLAIQGTTRWEKLTPSEGRAIYRIGIESEQVLDPENLWENALPELDK